MKITHYSFGSIAIDNETYTSDVIVYPKRVESSWWRREGHRLDIEDLAELLKTKPRVLIVGTGYYGNMRVPEETRSYLEANGIELHAARTADAVDLYNTMRDSAGTVAALHLTC